MRPVLHIVAVLLVLGACVASARAQSSLPPRPAYGGNSGYNYGPYSVYGPGLTYTPPSSTYNPYSAYGQSQASGPSSGSYVRVGSVLVPDGGESLVARYGRINEGRNEAGTPVLGKTPYLNRGFNNVGYGKSIHTSTSSVRVRIIRMDEEEERQTGVRP